MEKKFIKDLKEDEVIHAPTRDIAEKLCKKFDELGLRWLFGDGYINNNSYYDLGVETCYRPAAGTHSSIVYYRENGYTIYTIDDLLDFDEPKFKRGERVLVKYNEMDDWEERIFIAEIKGAIEPYLCVTDIDEYVFNEGEPFYTEKWVHIKKKPNTFTRKQIAEALGVEDFEIVD